jgi:hypothetical protein
MRCAALCSTLLVGFASLCVEVLAGLDAATAMDPTVGKDGEAMKGRQGGGMVSLEPKGPQGWEA